MASLLVSIPTQIAVAPSASANLLGTVYEAPNMAFGGGNGPSPSNCTAGQVVVGVTFNQNPMVWGYKCAPLNPDGTISPLTTALRSTANYVFCPDGTAGVGMRMINSGGYRLALVCKTPPGMGDTEQVTQFVKTQASPVFLTRTTESIVMQSMCNSGDVMMGTTTWQNLWFDQLRSRCAPFNKLTLSYNLNGGSGTAPATQTQSGPGTSLTVASGTGLTRAGFRFGGWNTLASAQGVTYAPGATLTPSANTTLFAIWESRITYHANGATSGSVPPNTEISGTTNITSLATNSGNLQLTGYTFGGWNTKADGTGTNYPAPTPAVITESPYMHFSAEDFNDSTNAWTGKNARNIPGTAVSANGGNVRGNPIRDTNVAGTNGSNKSFPVVRGRTTDGIIFGNEALNNYTFCHVARYAGGNRARIFAGTTGNWLSGFWNANSGVAHLNSWITSSGGWNDTNFRVQCTTGSTSSGFSGHYVNGVNRTTVTTNTSAMPADISINSQGSRTSPAETSDWEVAEFYIFDSVLSSEKIQHLEAMLNHKYGLTGFTASTLDTFDYASTGDLTLYAQWNSTVTYNGNGNTTAANTIPAPTTFKAVGATGTLALNGTLARTGYTFGGWNTRADGTGTNYLSGQTNYQTTGNITLYANWIAKIDYNSNTAAGSSDPTTRSYSPGVTSILASDLAAIGTMSKPGYKLGGWNTKADGSGITYPEKSESFALPSPYMHFLASKFNNATKAWPNEADSSLNINGSTELVTSSTTGHVRTNSDLTKSTLIKSSSTAGQNGTSKTFEVVKGSTADGIVFKNEELKSFTLCHVARYSGATKGAIFVALDTLWFTGFWSNRTSAAYYNGTWFVNSNGDTSSLDHWKVNCSTGTSSTNSSTFRENGVDKTTVFSLRSSLPANLTINLHANRFSPSYTSDWEVAEVLMYDSVLSEGQLRLLESDLCSKYGITCATPNLSYPITGNATLYAKWHANAYKITYDASTANAATQGLMASTTFSAGQTVSLRSNAFVNDGYTFDSWNTAANGSGTRYTNVQSVALLQNLVLYPRWNPRTPGTPTLTVTPGNSEVTVTPTAAALSSSSGPASSFTINAYANSSSTTILRSCTFTRPATSCVITGLTNGVAYSFMAVASNSTISGSTQSTNSSRVNGTPIGVPVTYNATNNGGSTTTLTATYNKPTALVLPVATKADAVFRGWYTTASGAGELIGVSGSTFVPTVAITLYARFVGNTYSISYNGNGNTGGEVPALDSFEAGTTPGYTAKGDTNPPTKIGYTFDGWYTNATGTGGTGYAVGATISLSGDLTLFAKWNPKTNTISYHANGGAGSLPTSGSYVTGNATAYTVLAKPDNLTRAGYEFSGWNTAANGSGTDYLASGSATLTTATDLVLYAKWRQITYSYSYQLNGGTSAQPASGTALYGETITVATAPTRTGFTFAGWSDGSNNRNAGVDVAIVANTIFIAQWTAQSFTITYDGNGSSSGVTASGSFTAGGVPYPIAANGFVKPGYNFNGWNTAANGSGTDYAVGFGYQTASTLSLFAKWIAASYTITYNGNGATGGTVPASGTYVTGATTPYKVASNSGDTALVKTGFTFVGWNTLANGSGQSYAVPASVTTTQNLTLYAQWNIISPSITFNDGEATASPTVFPTNTSAQYGSLFVLPNIDSSTVISSGDYRFAGWSDGANTYAVGDGYRVGVNDITFTAQWIQIFTVKYVLNGGSGTVPDPILRSNGFGETLTVNAVTRTGHTFTGWKDQSGASIPEGGGAWTINANSHIAYAQWTRTPVTLSFNLNGGTGAVNPITDKYVDEVVALPISNSTKEGYVFNGWRINPLYAEGSTYVVGTQDATFTAEWVGRTNTITYNGNGATGGTVPASGTYVTGATTPYTVASNSGDTALVKTGFTFVGWNTAANGSGTDYAFTGNATLTTSSDLILYAKWSAASFKVEYNTDGGSAAPIQSDTAFGSTFALPAAPTKSGYNFLGWETGSDADATLHAAGSSFVMPSRDVRFEAKWAGQSYVITYSLNGGSGTAPTQADVTHGNGFTTASAATRDGYVFAGWNNGTTTLVASTLVSPVTSNLTLVAQWNVAIPGTPGTPTVVPGNGSAEVSVVAPTSGGAVTSYTVTAAPGGATCTVLVPATSCTISPLTNGFNYTFTVTATNSAGTSGASSASTSVTPAGLPSAPQTVSGSGVGSLTNLTWVAPTSDGGSPILDYQIEARIVSGNDSDPWTTISDGTSINTEAAISSGLTYPNRYEFRIRACNVIGCSIPSFATSPVVNLPNPPTISSTVRGDGEVVVNLTAPAQVGGAAITGYKVFAYDSSGVEIASCTPDSGATSCAVTGLTNGTTYSFKAIAIAGANESALSASSNGTPATTPTPPTNLVVTNSGTGMTLTFTASESDGGSAITGYVITPFPTGPTCTRGATATTYNCTNLTPGLSYSYSAKAVNAVGQSSNSSATELITALDRPTSPQNVFATITAAATSMSALVAFDPPASNGGSEITGYTVTASPSGRSCTVPQGSTSCEITGLPEGSYSFSVIATNAIGNSNPQSSKNFTASNGEAPVLDTATAPAPSGTARANSALTSEATYTALPNSTTTYIWKRCTDAEDEDSCETISGATSASYTPTSGDVGKFIRVQTTATNSFGESIDLSAATEAIAAAPSPAPNPQPQPEPQPEPESQCDAACAAQQRETAKAAAEKAAAEKAAAEKAAAEKAAAEKAAAEKAAQDAVNKENANKKADEVNTAATKKAEEAKAAAEKFVEKITEATQAKLKLEEAAAAAAAKAKAAQEAKAAAEKAAADAKKVLNSKDATPAEKAAADKAAKQAANAAAKEIAAAANAAKEAAAVKEANKRANKQLDIAINSLTSKTASAKATAEANRIAAAAKRAATAAANQAEAKAKTEQSKANAAASAVNSAAAELITLQEEATTATNQLREATAELKELNDKVNSLSSEINTNLQELSKDYADQAAKAKELATSNDVAKREALTKEIELLNSVIATKESAVSVKQTQLVTLQGSLKTSESKVGELQNSVTKKEAAATKAKSDLASKTEEAKALAKTAVVAAKAAEAAKAAAAALPKKATIQAQPSKSNSKNSATATITGLKPGQKIKVTVNVGRKP